MVIIHILGVQQHSIHAKDVSWSGQGNWHMCPLDIYLFLVLGTFVISQLLRNSPWTVVSPRSWSSVFSFHIYLTLCRVWRRFRFLSSSNFLFSILASKLASSEATLLSRSFVFWTCTCIWQETETICQWGPPLWLLRGTFQLSAVNIMQKALQ